MTFLSKQMEKKIRINLAGLERGFENENVYTHAQCIVAVNTKNNELWFSILTTGTSSHSS